MQMRDSGKIVGFILCLASEPIQAELPLARLFTVFPPGATVGSTIEVSVSGADLDDPGQFLFSTTNLTGNPRPTNANKFVVTVASNALPGVYDARFVGRFGISNPRAFVVGDRPEIIEKEGNNTIVTAMEVPLGTVVNGHADASSTDFFKFRAKKGQRVLVECAAKAIDSRMDAALMLYDSSGRELERSRRGGLLDFTAGADGDYFLKVHDVLFRGGPEYFYRLSIGTGPHIDFIFPPAGMAGTKSKYILYGRNLAGSTPAKVLQIDGKALEQLEVEIALPSVSSEGGIVGASVGAPERESVKTSEGPTLRRSDAPTLWRTDANGFEYRLQTADAISNPVLICLATGPVVAEQEPNDKVGQAISPPCEVVGQFYPAGDQDRFTFEARKGEVYWAEIFSQRLGLPTSPFLLVQRLTKNEKGEEKAIDLAEVYASENNIGGTDFKTSTLDPSVRFEVKENGTCRIQVRDLFNLTQSNPARVYRLSLRKEMPDFRLIAFAPAPGPAKKDAREANVWSALLRRGETIPLKVLAFRRDNFDGEIRIAVEGLPPGVRFSETKIEAGKNSAVLLLTAAEDALAGRVSPSAPSANWAGPLRILGTAKLRDAEVIREARGGSVLWDVGDYNTESVQSRTTREVVLAMSGHEAAPISIAAGEGRSRQGEEADSKSWEVKVGSKAHIPLRVTRRGEFTESLKLKVTGISALDSMKEIEVDGKATNATLELDFAQYKVPPGIYTFYLQTQAKGKYRNNPEGAQAAELAAKEAEKAATDLAGAARQAADALAVATNAAAAAAAAAKGAAEKVAAAKTAEEKTPGKQELVAARMAAEKEAAEATAKASAAAETKAAAAKTTSEVSAKAKEAENRKTASANRAKELTEKAKPTEVTVTVYSAPIRLKVAAEDKKLVAGEKK